MQAVNQQLETQLPVGGIYCGIHATAAKELRLSKKRCASIERSTHGQSCSSRWIERRGRITASILHRVIGCKSGTVGLVVQIMDDTKAPRVATIRWGCDMEPKAKQAFTEYEAKKHKNLQLHECGLFVGDL